MIADVIFDSSAAQLLFLSIESNSNLTLWRLAGPEILRLRAAAAVLHPTRSERHRYGEPVRVHLEIAAKTRKLSSVGFMLGNFREKSKGRVAQLQQPALRAAAPASQGAAAWRRSRDWEGASPGRCA